MPQAAARSKIVVPMSTQTTELMKWSSRIGTNTTGTSTCRQACMPLLPIPAMRLPLSVVALLHLEVNARRVVPSCSLQQLGTQLQPATAVHSSPVAPPPFEMPDHGHKHGAHDHKARNKKEGMCLYHG